MAAEGQELASQRGSAFGGALDRAQPFFQRAILGHWLAEKLGVSQHDTEEIIEVVRNSARHASERFEPLTVGFRELPGTHVDFRFHLLRADAKFLGDLAIFASRLLQADEFSHVLDAMDYVNYFAIRIEYGRIYRTPMSFFEASTDILRAAYVVFLNFHRVGNAFLQNALQ